MHERGQVAVVLLTITTWVCALTINGLRAWGCPHSDEQVKEETRKRGQVSELGFELFPTYILMQVDHRKFLLSIWEFFTFKSQIKQGCWSWHLVRFRRILVGSNSSQINSFSSTCIYFYFYFLIWTTSELCY